MQKSNPGLAVVPGRSTRPHHLLWAAVAHVIGAALSVALAATFLSHAISNPYSPGRTLAVVACSAGVVGTGAIAVRLAFFRVDTPMRTVAQAYWTPTIAVAFAGAFEGPSGTNPAVFALSLVFLAAAAASNGVLFWRHEMQKRLTLLPSG